MPNSEATQDDFDRELEGYSQVSTDFGTKIEWADGVRFSGTFDGTRSIPVDGEDATAADFTDESDEPFWSWVPFQLGQGLSRVKQGSTVLIICTGEDMNAPVTKGRNRQLGFKIGVK